LSRAARAGREVDDQLEPRWPDHRKIGQVLALEHARGGLIISNVIKIVTWHDAAARLRQDWRIFAE